MTSITSPAAQAAQPARSRKRILVPLAGLLVAAAITVGSGADFVANSVNTGNAFTTGTLTQSNSKADKAIFNLNNMKPGDTLVSTVIIGNTGSLPATIALTESAVNGFVTAANLQLTITQGSTAVWTGTFGTLGTAQLGEFAAGESREYTFSVKLAQTATNAEQAKTATAIYTWNSTQLAATVHTQP
jgi:spore coat-associated protein N